MPQIRVLSGRDAVRIFEVFGFSIAHQRGSHVKLKRTPDTGAAQTLTVPLHDEIDKGTLMAIYRQALRYIPQDELRKHFYSE